MAKRKTQSSSMRSQMALGDFLVAYLARAGVSHLFGLPGDLVLGLFHRFGRERDLEIVTFSHEPTVGFAAGDREAVENGSLVKIKTTGMIEDVIAVLVVVLFYDAGSVDT